MKSGSKPLAAASVLIFLINVCSGNTCNVKTEYKIGDQCCSLCPAGKHVRRDCTDIRGTSCNPCVNGTSFTTHPSGLRECLPCTSCGSGSGLKTDSPCTTTSDTVCGPLEGFYCTDNTASRCLAQRHSRCGPGQFIKQAGTARTDTECSPCSNGTSTSCQPRTQSSDPRPMRPGIASTAAESGKEGLTATASVVVTVLFNYFVF